MLLTHLVPWRGPRTSLEVRNSCRSPLGSLPNRMQRLFGDFFEDFAGESLAEWDRAGGGFLPTIDVSETDAEVVVTAELPGVEEKDVELSLTKDALTIDGKKEQESKDDS